MHVLLENCIAHERFLISLKCKSAHFTLGGSTSLTVFICTGVIKSFYFIVSGEISVYLVKIKVISITSELISYHFTSD